MKLLPLYTVPVASTAFCYEAFYYFNCILFDYPRDDGVVVRTGIRFEMPAATRERSERCCKAWHLEAYDTLMEVQDSPWAKEILADIPEYKRKWETHHYIIYLDGGCFEVIAASWDILPEYEGVWDDVFPDVKLFYP